jgi:hypothetical protein
MRRRTFSVTMTVSIWPLPVTMTTRLDGALKREIEIDGAAYVLTITPHGMTLVRKGKRKGFELEWSSLVSGDAALATALNASLTANLGGSPKATAASGARETAPKR